MVKTYQCPKYNEAVMYFWIGSEQKKVVFTNGYVFDNRPSTFVTRDMALQCAMEADQRFGKDYTIMCATREPIDDEIDAMKKANETKAETKVEAKKSSKKTSTEE